MPFYGKRRRYVGLIVEIPIVGDYKLGQIGERQVVMVHDRVAPKKRDTDHGIRVVENRCAHRGVRFCQQRTAMRAALSALTTSGPAS